MAKKLCERCHSEFDCAMTAGGTLPCWCLQLPIAQNISKKFTDCLCAKCLNEFTNVQTSTQTEEPDYYFDTNGLMVFTKAYHLKRGSCCSNGCRHCPY